jgi:RHS repeat-associated protein
MLPSGASLGFTYGPDGRVLRITVNDVAVIDDIKYFGFRSLQEWSEGTAPGSFRYRRSYDRDGRLETYTAGAGTRTVGYDAAGRVVSLSDSAGGAAPAWTFGYDGRDRLQTANSLSTLGVMAGLSLRWRYDATGNRTEETRAQGSQNQTRTFSIDASSNRVSAVDGTARTYEMNGSTASDGVLRYSSNARGRLSVLRAQGTGAVLARYGYNAGGERVCKAIGDSRCPQGPGGALPADGGNGDFRQYVYDQAGHLVGEYAMNGDLIAEHVWLDNTPVAVLKPLSTIATHGGLATGNVATYWTEPDAIDAPAVVVNAAHGTVWRRNSTPFGDAAAEENPAGNGVFIYNLRFPGQQYDAESKTHYNTYRDYDPQTGRYLQSDPAGLRDDLTTYAYAASRPLDTIDPLGLWKFSDIKSCEDLGRVARQRARSRMSLGGLSCVFCAQKGKKTPATQRDHYWPVKECWDMYQAGKISLSRCIYDLNKASNLVPSCGPCNGAGGKGGRPPTTYVPLPGYPTTPPFGP